MEFKRRKLRHALLLCMMIRYFFLLPVSVLVTLLAYLLAPVLPLFANASCWLPRWLWWFQTPDNSLLGDDGHRIRWAGESEYLQMVAWLFRNPAYGFEWDGPLAATIPPLSCVEVWGNPWIKNRANAVAGWYFCRVGSCWNFKWIKPLWGDTALMLELGWKLQGCAQGRETEGKVMFVFSPRLTAFCPGDQNAS